METKQTALEWLESQQEIQDMINVYSCDAQLFLRMIFDKAKALQKEQIIQTYWEAYKEGQYSGDRTAEEYYNVTYKKDNAN